MTTSTNRILIGIGLVSLLFGGLSAFLLSGSETPIVAIAVQGDGDNIIDEASAFLTGCGFSCEKDPHSPKCSCTRSTLHVPLSWTTKHFHLEGLPDYSPFYRDLSFVDVTGPGRDDSHDQGLEHARLVFYAGHGTPQGFDALDGKHVELGEFSLGDGDVRYLWMLSCNVMAHGKETSGGSQNSPDFIQPQEFKPENWSPGLDTYKNVFFDWTKDYGQGRSPLNRGLRLACGGSSRIGSGDFPTRSLWHYRSLIGLGPAESFLLGLYKPESFGIPLCISRGGRRPESSGLYDSRFYAEKLKDKLDSVYIEYPVAGKKTDPLVTEVISGAAIRFAAKPDTPVDKLPLSAPALTVGQAPPPSFVSGVDFGKFPTLGYGFRGGSAKALGVKLDFLNQDAVTSASAALFSANDICIKRQPKSGETQLSLFPTVGLQGLSEEGQWRALENIGRAFLRKLLKDEKVSLAGVDAAEQLVLSEVQPIETHINGMLAEKAAGTKLEDADISHTTKCRYLLLRRAHRGVPVSGDGSEVFLRLCPSHEDNLESPEDICRSDKEPVFVLSFTKSLVKEAPASTLKTNTAAQAEALNKLAQQQPGAADLYFQEPESTRWSYRAAPVHCSQKEMYIVYEFVFLPKPEAADRGYGPVTIEIPAHALPPDAEKIEDTWQCSSEQGD